MIRMLVTAIALLLLTNLTLASEIDSFHPRYEIFQNGLSYISQETDVRIDRAVRRANKFSSCGKFALEAFLAIELMRPTYGQIEHYLNSNDSIPKYKVKASDSIYKSLPPFNYLIQYLGEKFVHFGVVVRQDKLLIGADKFGHFIDEGFWLFTRLKTDESNLLDVLTSNENSENGLNGLLVGGVKSYGDLNANYNGMRFWVDMLRPESPGAHPYVKCENGKWNKFRTFDFTEYVNSGWDEGINCNSYQSDEYEKAVLSEIQKLESLTQKKMACPIYPEECEKLVKHYGVISSKLLHPKCLAAAHFSNAQISGK